jgi:hypothetical protein
VHFCGIHSAVFICGHVQRHDPEIAEPCSALAAARDTARGELLTYSAHLLTAFPSRTACSPAAYGRRPAPRSPPPPPPLPRIDESWCRDPRPRPSMTALADT